MKKLLFTLLAALLLLNASAVHAQPSGTTIRLASVDNLPPYVFLKNGELTGLSIDIIEELARRGDFKVEIETSPWVRVLLSVEQGLVDGAFPAYKTKKRENFCLYTGIIHYDELGIAVKKGKEFHYTDIKSLFGKTVGKGRGVFVGDAFNAAVSEGRILVSETDDMKMTNIKKLHEGRLDAVIGSPVALMHYVNELAYDNIVILPERIRERIPAYLILSKKSALTNKKEWQQKLTNILDAMHHDGAIKAIYKRYGVEDFDGNSKRPD